MIILGSSTANGWGASSHRRSWAGLLASHLDSLCSGKTVTSFTVNGYTTWQFVPKEISRPQGRPAIDPKVSLDQVLARQPSLVILQLNSNDPAMGFLPAETIANHRLFLDSLRAHGIDAIEIGPFPRSLPKGNVSKIRALKDSLTRLVSPEKRVELWDSLARDSVSVQPRFSAGDAVHLNDEGHALIYRQLARMLDWASLCPEP